MGTVHQLPGREPGVGPEAGFWGIYQTLQRLLGGVEYTRALQRLLGGVRSGGLPAQALQLQLSPCRVHGAYEDFQGHLDPLGTG